MDYSSDHLFFECWLHVTKIDLPTTFMVSDIVGIQPLDSVQSLWDEFSALLLVLQGKDNHSFPSLCGNWSSFQHQEISTRLTQFRQVIFNTSSTTSSDLCHASSSMPPSLIAYLVKLALCMESTKLPCSKHWDQLRSNEHLELLPELFAQEEMRISKVIQLMQWCIESLNYSSPCPMILSGSELLQAICNLPDLRKQVMRSSELNKYQTKCPRLDNTTISTVHDTKLLISESSRPSTTHSIYDNGIEWLERMLEGTNVSNTLSVISHDPDFHSNISIPLSPSRQDEDAVIQDNVKLEQQERLDDNSLLVYDWEQPSVPITVLKPVRRPSVLYNQTQSSDQSTLQILEACKNSLERSSITPYHTLLSPVTMNSSNSTRPNSVVELSLPRRIIPCQPNGKPILSVHSRHSITKTVSTSTLAHVKTTRPLPRVVRLPRLNTPRMSMVTTTGEGNNEAIRVMNP